MTDDELAQRIAAHLRAELAAKGVERTIEPQDRLISSGLLSSVDVLGLVAFLEDELGVEIAAHEIGPDRMDTIDAIVALVRAKREEEGESR